MVIQWSTFTIRLKENNIYIKLSDAVKNKVCATIFIHLMMHSLNSTKCWCIGLNVVYKAFSLKSIHLISAAQSFRKHKAKLYINYSRYLAGMAI